MALTTTKVQMTVMALTHQLVAKILVCSVECLFMFSSLHTLSESVVDTRFLPRLQAI